MNHRRKFNTHKSYRPTHSRGNNKYRIKKELDFSDIVRLASLPQPAQKELPITSFDSFDLEQQLQENVVLHNYTNATPIQAQAIPHILEGKDLIGIANTGTGKTAAFLIPMINKVLRNPEERVIIMTPTRELAKQIADELNYFIQGTNIHYVLTIGGTDMFRQIKKLHLNPHFVIGTPGRLKDLIERNKLHLHHFHSFVLDEVDKMVDIGFIEDIKYFVSLLPHQRHSLFFSATVTEKVRSILHDFVHDPVTVTIKSNESRSMIRQELVKYKNESEKLDILHDLLTRSDFTKVLIFGRTKWGIDKLARSLEERGFKTAALHGNKSQGQRQRALDQFKQERVHVLLATDVASRGLDIDNVSHVINYDPPESYDDYIHRIGRTGRAGRKGTALTFVK